MAFDHTYLGTPLVNALCVGVLRHEDLHLAKATGPQNKVILYGASTGPDGIGGVSVLASESFDDMGEMSADRKVVARPSTSQAQTWGELRTQNLLLKRPSVQVSDLFMEKLHRMYTGDLR